MENKILTRTASFLAGGEQANDNANAPLTFCIVSKNSDAGRIDFFTGEYYIERLSVAGADTSELTTLFKDHEPSVDNAIARIENIRIVDDELLCDCVFSSDKSAQIIRQKYIERVLSDVSIGYLINDERVISPASSETSEIREVTSFKILELSAVWRGADSGAKKREILSLKSAQNLSLAREREIKIKEKIAGLLNSF
ncbi:hypothetical protein CINF_1284 [Candidatus Campylobacter infans]|uniref:HK97 family phage prohead protease n=1 Tax=Candidatus Campylobacter infans TaxID=2561898 RepID=A0A7H9CI32_9BACT|nr:peptidase [Candidatus Campylobacter infans]QLI05770.1 hypothetical protein CINF_1284 [Candidatus Campylobacter infans]